MPEAYYEIWALLDKGYKPLGVLYWDEALRVCEALKKSHIGFQLCAHLQVDEKKKLDAAMKKIEEKWINTK